MANVKVEGKINAKSLELDGGFSALKNVNGGFSISDPLNVGIELGRRDGTPGTPYIDFCTDGMQDTDYNARLISEGNALNVMGQDGLKINGVPCMVSRPDYNTGWFTLKSNTDYQFNHNLGTTDFMVVIEVRVLNASINVWSQYMINSDGTSNSYAGGLMDTYRDENIIKLSAGRNYAYCASRACGSTDVRYNGEANNVEARVRLWKTN